MIATNEVFRLRVHQFCNEAGRLRHPTVVLAELHKVVQHYQQMGVFGCWYVPRRLTDFGTWAVGETVFFGPDIDGPSFTKEYLALLKEAGGSDMGMLARMEPTAFTFTEAMHQLQLSGRARWLFDLFQRHGIRDALYCPFRHWMLLYRSKRVLGNIPPVPKAMLYSVANVAVGRINRLVKQPQRLESKAALTEREIGIFRLLSFGQTERRIAADLKISPDTVRTHIVHATKKLGAKNSKHAIAEAFRQGILE